MYKNKLADKDTVSYHKHQFHYSLVQRYVSKNTQTHLKLNDFIQQKKTLSFLCVIFSHKTIVINTYC